MRYISTLIAVRDLAASLRFYREALGMEVVQDFGANVVLSGGVALQTLESWREFLGGKPVSLRSHTGELYFEEADMDGFLERPKAMDISYVHPPLEHRWGQRVVRFYDPDGHIVEVGEDMTQVVKRFAAQGMTEEQVARRMDVSLDYVRERMEG